MAEFDVDKYWRDRTQKVLNEPINPNDPPKVQELQAASKQKLSDLVAYRDQLEKNRQADMDSWVSRNNIDPDSLAGFGVNVAARGVELVNRGLRNVAAGSSEAYGASMLQSVPQEVRDAFQRYREQKATPEDIKLLSQPALQPNQNTRDINSNPLIRMMGLDQQTYLEKLRKVEDEFDKGKTIRTILNQENLIHKGNERDLTGQLSADWREEAPKIKEGWDKNDVGQMAQGVGSLLTKYAGAIMDNKQAALEMIAEELPGIVMAGAGKGMAVVSNLPYLLEVFGESVQDYRKKNGGAMPSNEELAHIGSRAAAAMAMESVSDKLLVGAGKAAEKVGEGVAKVAGMLAKDTTEVAKEAASKGFKEALKKAGGMALDNPLTRVSGKTLMGGISEGPTEAVQTWLEKDAKREEATGEELYVSGALGAMVGKGIRGPMSVVEELAQGVDTASEALKKGAQKQDAKQAVTEAQKQAVEAAAKTGEVDALLDASKPTYAPDEALKVLLEKSQRTDLSPEDKAATIEKANQAVVELEAQRDRLVKERELSSPEGIQAKLDSVQKELAALAPNAPAEDLARLQAREQAYSKLLETVQNNPKTETNLRDLDTRITRLNRSLETSNNLLTQVQAGAGRTSSADLESDLKVLSTSQEPAARQASASRIITAAMSASPSLTPEQAKMLSDDESTPFTPEQRDYLRRFSEAKLAELALRTADDVSRRIFEGEGRDIGIDGHRERVNRGLAAGNKENALKAVEGLSKFAKTHRSKADAVAQAWKQGKGTQVLRKTDGTWFIPDQRVSKEVLEENKGFIANSADMVKRIQQEAEAIEKAELELRLAIQVKFGKPTSEKNKDVENVPSEEEGRKQESTEGKALQKTEGKGNDAQSPSGSVRKEPESTGSEEDVKNSQTDDTPPWDEDEESSNQEAPPWVTEDIPEDEAPASGTNQTGSENTQGTQKTQETEGKESESTPTGGDSKNTSSEVKPTEQVGNSTDPEVPARAPGLSILENAKEKAKAYVGWTLGQIYRKGNRVIAWVRQRRKSEVEGFEMLPLVEHPDLMARWMRGDLELSALLPQGYELSEQERKALDHFAQFHAKWADRVRQSFIKGALRKNLTEIGAMLDPVQDFLNEDGSVDEAIVTAVTYAAYTWIARNAQGPSLKDPDDLLKMHGLDPKTNTITDEGVDTLKGVRSTTDVAIASMGQSVLQALGLQVSQDAASNYESALASAFGSHAWNFLMDPEVDLIQELIVGENELQEFMPSLEIRKPNTDKSGKQHWVTRSYVQIPLARNKETRRHEVVGPAREIKEVTQGSKSILDRFFGSKAAPMEASWEPIPFDQKKAKRSSRSISSDQLRILKKAQQVENRVIPEMWDTLEVLGDEVILKAAGYADTGDETNPLIPAGLRAGQEAKNEGLHSQLDGMKALVRNALENSPLKLAQPFFHNLEVWKNNRVGVTTHDMNLQSSKIHRFMFFRPEWEEQLDLESAEHLDAFEMAMAQALGVKIDQMDREAAKAKFHAKLKDKDGHLLKHIEALHAARTKKTALTDEQKQAIADIAAGEEGMQTLQALVAYGDYLAAKKKYTKASKDKREALRYVPIRMLVGADGKTNGPILSFLALGVASDGASLFNEIRRGGMYSVDDEDRNFNLWFAKGNNLDLYQDLMKTIAKFLDLDSEGVAHVSRITGNLVEGETVTKAGRNIVKPPLTAFTFGSSVQKSIDNMSAVFVETIYTQIGAIQRGDGSLTVAELVESVNFFLPDNQKLDREITLEQLVNLKFSKTQEKSLRSGFQEAMGAAVEEAMKTRYAAFIQGRNLVNNMAQASFEIYNTVYEALYQQEMERLMDAGEIEFTTRTNKKTQQKIRVPYHRMSTKQEQAFREQVKDLLPIAQTAYSQRTGELDAGYYMAKSRRMEGDSGNFPVEVNFGNVITRADGQETSQYKADLMMRQEISPGVAVLPGLMHGSDSAVMHYGTENTESLNVHDEVGNSFLKVREAAERLNFQVFNTFSQYSPMEAVYAAFEKSLINAAKLQREGKLTREQANAVLAAVWETIPKHERKDLKFPQDVLPHVAQMKNGAMRAKRVRLDALSQMASIDQYTWEGGEYQVTDADRAAVAKLLEQANKESYDLSPELQAAIQTLTSGTTSKPSSKQALSDDQQETFVTLPMYRMIMQKALQDPKLRDDVRKDIETVLDALSIVRDFDDALRELRNPLAEKRLRQVILARINTLEPHQHAFGELGTPKNQSNPDLVDLFEKELITNVKDALGGVEEAIRNQPDAPYAAYYKALVPMLLKAVNGLIPVKYLTRNSKPSDVQAISDNSLGWASVRDGKAEVVIKGTDFEHSAVRVELLLHEIVHAGTIAKIYEFEDNQNNEEWRKANPDTVAYVEELNQLLELARKNDPKGEFAYALSNLAEFTAMGMTNAGFQKFLSELSFKTANNSRIKDALQGFIHTLAKLLFGKTSTATETALYALITNTAGLMQEVQLDQQAQASSQPRTAAMPSSFGSFDQLTTLQVHEALDDGKLTPEFSNQLASVLTRIVDKLQGPFGKLRNAFKQSQASTVLDAWLKAQATGVAAFASSVSTSPLGASTQEAFTMEMVEATMLNALDGNESMTKLAYKELMELYLEAKAKLSAKDFYEGPDWNQATAAEKAQAQAEYDYLFDIQPSQGNHSDYLARFAAMGLGHHKVNALLKFSSQKDRKTAKTFGERLQNVFEQVLSFFSGLVTKTFNGQQADLKLAQLVEQLVDIEAKRVMRLSRPQDTMLASVAQSAEDLTNAARNKVRDLMGSNFIRNNTSGYVRGAGALARTVLDNRVDQLIETILRVRDNQFKNKTLGLVGTLMTEYAGPLKTFEALLRFAKRNEGIRKDIISGTASMVLDTFEGGKAMDRKDKKAVTNALLRTGAHVLTDRFSFLEIQELMENKATRDREIAALEQSLAQYGTGLQDLYIQQANVLAYYKATGEVKGEFLLKNAHNIVNLHGTPYQSRTAKVNKVQAEQAIKELVTLYAIDYMGHDRDLAAAILARENQRTDGNGVRFILSLHKRLEEESLARLFKGNPTLMEHGYLPEIVNPHTDVKVVTKDEADELASIGYKNVGPVSQDPSVPGKQKYLMVLPDGGLMPYVTGAISFSAIDHKGSTLHSGFVNPNHPVGAANASEMARVTNAKLRSMMQKSRGQATRRQDLSQVKDNFMVPLLDDQGNVVNYRYEMQGRTRDVVLERDNRFEHLLGASAGSIFDRETAPKQNEQVLQALREQYQMDLKTRADSYVEIGPKSKEPRLRELWKMLPEQTKDDARRIWGGEAIFVRNDLVDVVFGQRAYSLSEMFHKTPADRKFMERVFVKVVETVLEQQALLRGKSAKEAQAYANSAAVRIVKAERIWQEFVKEVKDLIVIKSVVVLLGNIWSNLTLLKIQGVSWKMLLNGHLVALRGATAYQRDNRALQRAQMKLDAGYLFGQNQKDLEQEILRLKDAIARNPVTKLIEAGLMPTIVEDVSMDDDPYSYKSGMARWLDEKTAKVPDGVKKAVKTVYMAHDTPFYQGLSRMTQLSDFVARYTLYQHLTTRAKNPLSHQEAINEAGEAFINYDIPMHRGLQYMDNMGFMMFTKYFMRVQRVLLKVTREKPLNVLSLALLNQYMDLGPIVLEGSMVGRLGNNPLTSGPFEILDVWDEHPLVQGIEGLVK